MARAPAGVTGPGLPDPARARGAVVRSGAVEIGGASERRVRRQRGSLLRRDGVGLVGESCLVHTFDRLMADYIFTNANCCSVSVLNYSRKKNG